MKHKPWNIFFHELIGLHVKILRSLNPREVGIEGRIIYETRRTLLIQTETGPVRIMKTGTKLLLRLPAGETVEIEGDNILGDPAERSKRLKRGRR